MLSSVRHGRSASTSSQKVGASLSVAKNRREQVDLGFGAGFNRSANSAIVPRWKPAGL
jgi:hypothetical protein